MNEICLNERDAEGRIIVENIFTGEKKAYTQEEIERIFTKREGKDENRD